LKTILVAFLLELNVLLLTLDISYGFEFDSSLNFKVLLLFMWTLGGVKGIELLSSNV
jgi:hypothetical protein